VFGGWEYKYIMLGIIKEESVSCNVDNFNIFLLMSSDNNNKFYFNILHIIWLYRYSSSVFGS